MSITSTTATLEVFVSRMCKKMHRLATGVLCLILLACPHAEYRASSLPLPQDTLDRVLARGTLRAVSRVNPATFVVDRHGPAGIEYELAEAFAREIGVSLEMIPAANIGEAYAALDAGRADIATAGLTERRARDVPYAYSAPYLGISQQVVYRSGDARPESLVDLVGSRVMVLASTSSADALRRAQAALPKLAWMESTRGETADLLSSLAAGEVDYVVLKSHEFYVHEGLFPSLEVAFDLPEPEQLAWAIRQGPENHRLFSAMQNFLVRSEREGELDELRERFYGHLPETNRLALSAFARRVDSQLPRYEALMRRIGEEEGIDWRLLAAISYQESHWNPGAVSRKGAAGMMMLMPQAASEVGIRDRRNAEQSLRGGARYFLKLAAELPQGVAANERELFILAAYNMGPRRLQETRRLTAERGANPDLWSDVEQQLRQGANRGSQGRRAARRNIETVTFVSRVRQYHRFLSHHDDEGGLYAQAGATERTPPG